MVPEERPVHDVEQDEAGGEEPPRDAVHQHGLLPPLLHQVTDFFLFLGMSVLHIHRQSSPSAGTSCAHLRGLLVDTGDGDSREGEGRLGVLLLVLGGRGRGGQRGAVHVVALHTAVTTIIPRPGPCLVLQLRAASRHAAVVSGLVLAAGAGGPRLVTSATSDPR